MAKKKQHTELSPNQKAFKRLMKNKPAIFGLFLIGFALLISILGYLITPDHSPNANDQVNEVALKSPMFKTQMLKVRKNRAYEKSGFFKTMLFGRSNPYQLVPLNQYEIKGDSIFLDVYQGEDRAGKSSVYHLVDVVFPISVSDLQIDSKANQFAFYPLDRPKSEVNLETLQTQWNEGLRSELPKIEQELIYPELEIDSSRLQQLQNSEQPVQWLRLMKNGRNQSGETKKYWLVPGRDWSFCGDSLCIQQIQLAEDTIPGKELKVHLVDALYQLPEVFQGIEKEESNQTFQFYDNTKPKKLVDADSVRQVVSERLIYTHRYMLGTDKFGRDLLSRLMIGVRISLSVGLVAVLISLTIGIFLGAVAGFFGGRTDDLIMLLINTMWSIPTLLLVFALVLALGRGFWQIFTAVGLTMWVDVARIVRGQVMSLKEIQFVEAARSFGFGSARIIRRHILPNIFGPVMVIAAANFAAAILIEAGLSYLGFGIQPPQPSWGTMLSENYSYLIKSDNPFPALAPGLAIMLMVLAFNLVGNGLRDALDVKTRK